MPALAGFNGRIRITTLGSAPTTGGVLMPASRWQVTWKVDALDVTTFESTAGGAVTPVSEWIPGITDLDLSFDVLWDTTLSVFSTAPPDFKSGNFVGVCLYIDKSALSRNWVFSNVLIVDIVQDAEVRGVIKYSVTARQSGGPVTQFYPVN